MTDEAIEFPFPPRAVAAGERELDERIARESNLPPGLDFTASRGACLARWGAPLYVTIELDRFGEDHGELRAEVVVRYTAPGLERQLLAPRRVPLLGTRAPGELAKDLGARMRDVDWRELLEQAFTEAIRAYRVGEPEVLLSEVPTRITPRYALAPLALHDLPTVIWARPDSGKTWMACVVAVALHAGRSELLGLTPATPLRVGILDWEDDAFTKAERVQAIAGSPVPGIVYVACRSAIWDELDRIQRIVRERGLEYLVIDSIGMACGGLPPESSEAALRYGAAIRRIGLGTLATAHLTKDAMNESAPFGSVFWLAQLRLGWLLKREQELGERGFTFGLFRKKSNNDRAPAPLAYEFSSDGGRVSFRRRDVRDVPELAPQVSLRWRIEHELRTGPRTYAELSAALDESVDSVSKTCRRHEGKAFTKVTSPDGIYRVALRGHEDAG